jgi:Cysteine dioxygenase type I
MSPVLPARFAAPVLHSLDPAPIAGPRTPPDPALARLVTLVRALAHNTGLWQPRVQFTETRYWTRLPAPEDVDVWLLTWLPEQGTELHDHGDSAAAFTVVGGTLTELRVDDDGELSAAELSSSAVRTVAPGVVHDVQNHHVVPAISIHAYAPKLRKMTYYRWSDGGLEPTRTVFGDEPEKP